MRQQLLMDRRSYQLKLLVVDEKLFVLSEAKDLNKHHVQVMERRTMKIVSGVVLAVRFIVELLTVAGLASAVIVREALGQKLFFGLLALLVVVLWGRYGAPKSPHVLEGTAKLLLEVAVYSVGSICFFVLFGFETGAVYTSVVIIDLLLMYALKLQGH